MKDDGPEKGAGVEATMSSERLRLLSRLAANDGVEVRRFGILPLGRTRREFPQSFAQERLWFLHRLEPANPAYHIAYMLPLTIPLDEDRMRRALKWFAGRHEGFRTQFVDRDGHPVQVVMDEPVIDLTVDDLRDVAEADREAALAERIEPFVEQPFELATGNVFRVRMLRIDAETWLVALVVHHIVTDAWSAGLIVRDFLHFLQADEDTPEVAPLPVQSADYAVWERSRLEDGTLELSLQYWRERLDGLKPLQLPYDRPRPPRPSSRAGAVGGSMGKEVTAGLEDLSRDVGAPLFRVLLAALQILLLRVTGSRDVVIGTPVSGSRDRPELAQVVGCFLNMVVLRGEVGREGTFADMLRHVNATTTEDFGHQLVPFEVLVRELRPDRASGTNPLFNVTMTLDQPHPTSEWTGERTLGEVVGLPTGTIRFDIEIVVTVSDGRLSLGFLYADELFERATIERWVDDYKSILEAVSLDPTVSLQELVSGSDAVATTAELLRQLRGMGVKISSEDGKLRVNAPKGALSSVMKAQLGERKEEILAFLDSARRAWDESPVLVVDRAKPVLASFAQQRLWFLDQLAPGSPAYNIPSAVRTGRLDEAAMASAFDAVLARHETLRTSFRAGEDGPVLVVHAAPLGLLEILDLSHLDEEAQESELGRIVHEKARKGFDLAVAPLLRATLINLNAHASVLVWSIHHIVSDGWSQDIFARDLIEFYRAALERREPALPELSIQFTDYAAWQRTRIEGESVAGQLSYWTRQLAGELPVMELPTDRPRPPVQTMSGARTMKSVGPELTRALKDMSQREGVTLFMTLLAAFQVFLHRYTGGTDIVVGTPTAGRSRPEFEDLVGFFVNNLVLRTEVDPEEPFRSLQQKARRAVLDAHANQDVPFDQLVEVLRPQRSMSHPPLFQVMFNSPTAPREASMASGDVAPIDFQVGTSRFDLTIEVIEHAGELNGGDPDDTDPRVTLVFEYNTDLFDPATIDGFADTYRAVLADVVAEPDRSVGRLSLLPEAQREQILNEWNDTAAPYPQDAGVHDLFVRQARQRPDDVAVVAGGHQLTYGELESRSAALAARLRQLGVGPGSLVAVCVDRSCDMPVAMMGVLRAGGAYVPLDPSFPSDRLAFMVQDSGARVLLTQSHLVDTVPSADLLTLLVDGQDQEGVAAPGNQNESSGTRDATPGDTAYVIYTSGSTGRPKGVQVPHSAVVNFLTSMAREPGLSADDRLLAVTTLSFDIAGLELFLPLTEGARVHIASRSEATDPIRLAELITESGATVMQATPATWRLLVQSGWEGRSTLRMLCGGEALDRELAEQLLPMGSELWNLYGPTEATIWSSLLQVTEDVAWPVSIGRPIANTEMYILDDHFEPVPVGVQGELFIGGAGLAIGYLGRPELTAERFVRHPFERDSCARLYRTGDGARYRRDGTIEFLGRLDTQVKVRGFRIELGEIESNLMEWPGVTHAAVTVREDVPGDQRLVAYVVAEGDTELAQDSLQGHLKKCLPDYMIPTTFVQLPKLPLTPNGKIDRRALPTPGGSAVRDAFEAPETESERTIAEVWQEVLRIDKVGAKDNFFDLGGHSLLAVRVHSELQKRLPNPPSLIDLFQYPTVSALARHVAGEEEGSEALDRARDRAAQQMEAR